ncbi:MAG: hypothetical protein ACRDSK_13630 [Actinophytocola sp.]|uniref:hypothetical protein n=1 Tax=Actinophytocola sp. TaxID=1872138 RepID=UPI003D6C4F5A
MALERYEPNRRGLLDILKSEGVRLMLHGRAERVAAAARAKGQMMGRKKNVPLPIVVDSGIGQNRARAAVIAKHAGALAAERKNRILGSAIDAAKD